MDSLRIGIDVSALSGPRTGIGYYTANLIDGLSAFPDLELLYFDGARWTSRLDTRRHDGGWRYRAGRLASRALRIFGSGHAHAKLLFRELYSQRRFRSGVERLRPGLFHSLTYDLVPDSLPSIATVYDLSCFRHPETHLDSRVAWQRRQMPRCIEAADHVITISNFSRQEICEYFGVPADRVSVCYCGVDERFRPRTNDELLEALAPLALQPGGYVLTVGTLEPRKNLDTLIRAHDSLPPAMRNRFPLVIAGVPGWKQDAIMKLAQKSVKLGTIRMLGYVEHDRLPLLYAGARLFAFPSIYEGFGIPPLEAMASGIPVIVSNRSAMPEVAGGSSLCLDPLSVSDWSRAISELIDDDAAAGRLRKAGLERAASFTWRATAEATRTVYRRVLAAAG